MEWSKLLLKGTFSLIQVSYYLLLVMDYSDETCDVECYRMGVLGCTTLNTSNCTHVQC